MSRTPCNEFREWGSSELPKCREKSEKQMTQERLFGARSFRAIALNPVVTRKLGAFRCFKK